MNHTREREGDFRHMFGRLLGTTELSKRKLADMKVAVKAKRDDLIMMDNLIKLKEREVEDLQTEVNSVRSGQLKQSPASVTKINSPCKATSLSQTASQPDMAPAQSAPRTLDECFTLSVTTLAETELSKTQIELLKLDTSRQKHEIQVEGIEGKLAHQEKVRGRGKTWRGAPKS